MNVNGVTPAPAVYLSPQVWAPNVPGDQPIALALAARPEPEHKAHKDEAARKAADEVRRVTMHPSKPVSTVDLTGEGRHVDLYV
jgi:hypothetical protein